MITARSTFEELAFLSEEVHQNRASLQPQFGQMFKDSEEQFRATYSLFKQHPKQEIHSGQILGRAFMWRCLESCQGTIVLADRGMSAPAMSTARLAHEYLYYACALFLKPELITRLGSYHDKEFEKQINGLKNKKVFSDEKITNMQNLMRPEMTGVAPLKAQDAATAAGLVDLYETAYRSLGMAGAHATLVSAERAFSRSETGERSLIIGPDFSQTGPLLSNVNMCLVSAQVHYKQFLEALNGQSTSP